MYTKNNQEKRNLSLQYHVVIIIHNIFPCLYLTFDLIKPTDFIFGFGLTL